jgi:hypothetical protein
MRLMRPRFPRQSGSQQAFTNRDNRRIIGEQADFETGHSPDFQSVRLIRTG